MREAIPKLRIYNGTRIDDAYHERKVKSSRKELKQQKREAKAAEPTPEEAKAARKAKRKEERRAARAAVAGEDGDVEGDPAFDHGADFVPLGGAAGEGRADDREGKKQRMIAKKAARKAERQAAAQAATAAHPLTAPPVVVATGKGKRKASIDEAPSEGAGWMVDSAPAGTSQPVKKKRKRIESKHANGKAPLSVGGSLSAPVPPSAKTDSEPPPPTADDDERKRTAVAGIVKVSKRKPRKDEVAAVEALLRGEGPALEGDLAVGQW